MSVRLLAVEPRRDEHVGALTGTEDDRPALERILHVPAVDANQLERLAVAEHELEVAALRGVDDAPSLQRAIAHGHRRADPAVDEHVIAFAAEQRAEDAAAVRRMQFPVIVQSRCR